MAPDDLVHEAIVAALASGGLERAENLEAYLYRAISNVASNERRRLGRRRGALGRAAREAQPDTGRGDVYPSDLAHLAVLSPRSRAVLFLHHVESCSFEQIAELLGQRSSAVRQVAHRARRQLRLDLEVGTP